jgi:hypothetical protein
LTTNRGLAPDELALLALDAQSREALENGPEHVSLLVDVFRRAGY